MKISLNGEEQEVPEGVSAEALLQMLDLSGKRVAMEINMEVLPRSRFAQVEIRSGDRIEIVRAIGGG